MDYENDNDIFITINAFNKFHGIKPFKIGSILKLVKEPENNYDCEAIAVELRYAGKSGYVANSVNTVIKGTMSGGRVYDKILDEDYAQVKFISNDSIIAKILTSEEIDEFRKDPDNDLNFL
ncbi:MAG: hypothetical protein MJ203_04405 [archaeon]|nr:hypothetical protein [archaeon]